jgi:hypothetical protein
MQEPTARKRGRRPEAREGQGQKPGIFLKVLPSEEYCRLKPMPEKTRPLGFEQKQGIAIWYCQSVNPANNRADLGMEVMHERNAHNFPLDLAAGEVFPIALTSPVING